jgi:lipopolysaccharide transport system permease protein
MKQFPNKTLFLQMLKREITQAIKGSAFGFLWLILNPLLMMGLYTVVFGGLFKGSFTGEAGETSWHYALGIYIGISLVNFFNEGLSRASTLIRANENLVKKVVFPLAILPAVLTFSIGFKLVVNLLLCLFFAIAINQSVNLSLLWIYPVVLIICLTMGLGLSMWLSSVTVYVRDCQQITPILTQVIFWTSGIFYSLEKTQEAPLIWMFLQWNPFIHLIDYLRKALLWEVTPASQSLLFPAFVAGFALFVGNFFFSRLKKGFPDLI